MAWVVKATKPDGTHRGYVSKTGDVRHGKENARWFSEKDAGEHAKFRNSVTMAGLKFEPEDLGK